LKHWGRLQYGLFLKGAVRSCLSLSSIISLLIGYDSQGMELEEALIFWEGQFAKLVQHDQFQKQYAYSFRHMYGKEGARKNYTPYSCMKIIMGTPPEVGAHHGCPYRLVHHPLPSLPHTSHWASLVVIVIVTRHMPENQLASLLSSLQIQPSDVQDIVKTAKSGNYQIACQKHFDVTHPGHLQMTLQVPPHH
jgi:DNA primase large subunit